MCARYTLATWRALGNAIRGPRHADDGPPPGRHAAPEVVVSHLERHPGTLLTAREQYCAFERMVLDECSPDRPYWLATIRHGLAMAEAWLAWADETVEELRADGKEPGA